MSVNNALGDSGKATFQQVLPQTGFEVVAWEKFDDRDTDTTAQLTRIKGAKADAIIVWAIPPAAGIVAKNAQQLGMGIPLVYHAGVGNPAFIDLAGSAANGVIFVAGKLLVAEQLPDSDPQKPILLKLVKDYEAKYGPRSVFGANAYDGALLMFEALEKAGADRAKIRDYLENRKGFIGTNGIFNFSPTDHNGLDTKSLVMIEIVDGKWKLVK